MSYTYAIVQIARAAYDEIKDKLLTAGYEHAIEGGTIDMHGLALEVEPALVVHERMSKYAPNEKTVTQINNSFTYHAPKDDQGARYTAIRDAAKALAMLIAETTPISREQSLALTHLEIAVMQANAAISRNE